MMTSWKVSRKVALMTDATYYHCVTLLHLNLQTLSFYNAFLHHVCASSVDRYMVGTVRNASLNQREVKWFHTRSASAPTGQGKGGTHSKPSLFDIDGHRLVWRGCLNNSNNFLSMNGGGNNDRSTTVLIVGSIPPLHRGYVVSLLKNNDPISISITPESLDMKGR